MNFINIWEIYTESFHNCLKNNTHLYTNKLNNDNTNKLNNDNTIITKQPKIQKKKVVWLLGDPGIELVLNKQ